MAQVQKLKQNGAVGGFLHKRRVLWDTVTPIILRISKASWDGLGTGYLKALHSGNAMAVYVTITLAHGKLVRRVMGQSRIYDCRDFLSDTVTVTFLGILEDVVASGNGRVVAVNAFETGIAVTVVVAISVAQTKLC